MIVEWIRFGVVALLMLGGLFTLSVSVAGLFRFDFALNRIHAAAMADTLALFLFLLGVVVAVGWEAVTLKLVLVLFMQWCTSPMCSHMLSQFEYRTDPYLSEHVELPDAPYVSEGRKEAERK
jgi:multicomponent Na+:H+ antiporter subunit G